MLALLFLLCDSHFIDYRLPEKTNVFSYIYRWTKRTFLCVFINICGIVCYFVVAVATTAAAADNGRPNQSIKRIETNKGENFMFFSEMGGGIYEKCINFWIEKCVRITMKKHKL